MSKLFSYIKSCADTVNGYVPKQYATKNMLIAKPDYYLNGKVPVVEDYSFSILSNSAPNVIINGKEYTFDSKKVMILNPNDEIEIKNNGISNYVCNGEYTCILINRKLIEDISYNIFGKSKTKFSIDYNYITQQLRILLLMIEKEAMQEQFGKGLVLDSLETQFAIQLLRDFKFDIAGDKKQILKPNKNAIRLSVEFIEEYYNTNISLDELANISNMSKFHFIRMFKQVVGKTPYGYIVNKRIEEAQKLLCQNVLNINEIAQLCGFINVSHFSTVFKRIVGISPSDYAQQHF